MISWELFWKLYWVEIGYGLTAFIALFFISAPYGRHHRKGWGPSIAAKPAWIVQEFPAFAVIIGVFLFWGQISLVTFAFILIWQVHYFHRTFIYPFFLTSPQKPYPILLVVMAIVFNVLNGVLNGSEIFVLRNYETDWLWSPQFIGGLILFALGYRINKQSDKILTVLRKSGTEYGIPEGGMYRYVSCPNYLGEMLEWLGWAVLTWSFAGLGFFLFTVANLLPRALSNHRWYKSRFGNYPRDRKAVIPYLL